MDRKSSLFIATVDVLVVDVEGARVGNIMTYTHRRPDMRNDAVKLIEVKFLLITLLVALVAKAFQDEGRRAVAADLLHSARESLDVKHQESWKDLEGNRSDSFGVSATFITTEMILHTKILASDAGAL